MFDNLISNGLKYARPNSAPVLTIEWELKGTMVQFAVRDEGVGIPESQRARVFEPFVRLRASDAEGSGIGLAIVRRIVELYGGNVWIESAQGSGCTVKFTVPWFRPGETIAGIAGHALDDFTTATGGASDET